MNLDNYQLPNKKFRAFYWFVSQEFASQETEAIANNNLQQARVTKTGFEASKYIICEISRGLDVYSLKLSLDDIVQISTGIIPIERTLLIATCHSCEKKHISESFVLKSFAYESRHGLNAHYYAKLLENPHNKTLEIYFSMIFKLHHLLNHKTDNINPVWLY